jgi:hypothetical protein
MSSCRLLDDTRETPTHPEPLMSQRSLSKRCLADGFAVMRRRRPLQVLPLEISEVQVSDSKDNEHSRTTESGRDVVTGDDERLLVGWEGEDGDPGGKDVGECVHLDGR